MLRKLIKRTIAQAGLYYCKRKYLPMGVDWYQDIKRSLERAGKPRGIQNILDVGANIGQTTIELRKAFPGGVIHAFEPVGSTFTELLRNVGRMPDVHCHQLALCDERGTASMVVGHNSLLGRLSVDHANEISTSQELESVTTETVDYFCLDNKIGFIDLLKIDVEGAELSVLKGASGLLQSGRVGFVFIEVGFESSDTTHTFFPKIVNCLNDYGFGLCALYDYCRLRPPEYEREGILPFFGNALFCHRAEFKQLS